MSPDATTSPAPPTQTARGPFGTARQSARPREVARLANLLRPRHSRWHIPFPNGRDPHGRGRSGVEWMIQLDVPGWAPAGALSRSTSAMSESAINRRRRKVLSLNFGFSTAHHQARRSRTEERGRRRCAVGMSCRAARSCRTCARPAPDLHPACSLPAPYRPSTGPLPAPYGPHTGKVRSEDHAVQRRSRLVRRRIVTRTRVPGRRRRGLRGIIVGPRDIVFRIG